MSKKVSISMICLFLVFGTFACTYPSVESTTANTPTINQRTATLKKTQPATATLLTTPKFSTQTINSLTPTVPLQQATVATTNVQSTPCNRAKAGSPLDITIPDDTSLAPGQTFSKTWRIINDGSCTWSSNYAVVFFSGDLLSASRSNYLGDTVLPGDSIDITLDMVAPMDMGTYQGNWELSDPNGSLFGVGPAGNSPFWVRIKVIASDTLTPTNQPTATQTPTPMVLVTGLTNLIPNDHLDLDSNQVTAQEDDVLYSLENTNVPTLTPQNGASFATFGSNEPTFTDCKSANLVKTSINLSTVNQGNYFCFSTSKKNSGWLRYVALSSEDHTLTIEILTWSVPTS